MSIVNKLVKKNLINPPKFLPTNIHYETIMGSLAYGVSSDSSDVDVYGFCIPPKDMIFPHLKGEILGFGRQAKRFSAYQQHHIKCDNKEYDITIYSIVKYFNLAMENNPNIIDSFYTPNNCVLHSTAIGNMVREKRDLFLHKGAYYKFKGYSFAQMHKIKTKVVHGKRKESVDKYGYDIKYAYHLVRLLNEIQQILVEGTMDIQKNREQLKAIRRGEWTLDDVEKYFAKAESELESLYRSSTLRHSPDEKAIKELLLNCLEHHYGKLDNVICVPDKYKDFLYEIREKLEIVLKSE